MTSTRDFPYSSDLTDHLNAPGDLMAAVPGVLGFYPHESLIIVGLHADPGTHELCLGPVMRADLPHWAEITSGFTTPTMAACDVYFAFIITRSPDTPTVRELVDTLYSLHDDTGDALIDACWVLSEIATGSHYELSFGSVPAAWESGAVPCIALSPAMQPLLDNGGLPALSRDDTVEFFARIALDGDTRDTIDGATQLAYHRGQDLHERIERCLPGPAEAVADADRALTNAPALPLVAPYDEALSLSAAGGEDSDPIGDDVMAVMTCLSRSRLRDAIVATALDEPQCAATMLLYIARVTSGVIRANALSIWAIVAISTGLNSWATAALKAASAELEGHGLSTALLEALTLGCSDGLVMAVLAGSEEQRAQLREQV
ncbi:DUF4192 domain-containing protein [Corynebacterium pilosum]|nr:DUF4192 domain-containing protein [Corynebacterium pilosum]